jgi:hypothetical protein
MICGKKDDKNCCLIHIDGTEDGNICEAEQIHIDCLELRINKQLGVIYQKL